MARCSTVYGALAYMRSRMQWITSSGSVADLDRGAATFLQVNIAERWSDAALLRRGRIEVRLDGIRIAGGVPARCPPTRSAGGGVGGEGSRIKAFPEKTESGGFPYGSESDSRS